MFYCSYRYKVPAYDYPSGFADRLRWKIDARCGDDEGLKSGPWLRAESQAHAPITLEGLPPERGTVALGRSWLEPTSTLELRRLEDGSIEGALDVDRLTDVRPGDVTAFGANDTSAEVEIVLETLTQVTVRVHKPSDGSCKNVRLHGSRLADGLRDDDFSRWAQVEEVQDTSSDEFTDFDALDLTVDFGVPDDEPEPWLVQEFLLACPRGACRFVAAGKDDTSWRHDFVDFVGATDLVIGTEPLVIDLHLHASTRINLDEEDPDHAFWIGTKKIRGDWFRPTGWKSNVLCVGGEYDPEDDEHFSFEGFLPHTEYDNLADGTTFTTGEPGSTLTLTY